MLLSTYMHNMYKSISTYVYLCNKYATRIYVGVFVYLILYLLMQGYPSIIYSLLVYLVVYPSIRLSIY
jgi:hypothetical protein